MVPLAKGGAQSPYYCDLPLCVSWGDDGRQLKAYLSAYRSGHGWGDQWTAVLNGHHHYGRPGLTWPSRTNGLSVRALPAASIFGAKGPAILVTGDDPEELLHLLAIVNSAPFGELLGLQLGRIELAQSFEVGLIQSTPVPRVGSVGQLASLARRGWSLQRSLDTVTEVSHAFVVPAVLHVEGGSFAERMSGWSA
ncbi:MAG: hypothetical protein GY798_24440, partial [Hyphomicrobiales bacterium]|nr:hypothetical protein [Hyphomicrobiales bacterium]